MSHTRTGIVGVLEGCSPAVRKLNAHLVAHLVAGQVLPEPYQVKGDPYNVAPRGKEGERRRLRQSSVTLNKTEQRFHDWHRANFPDRLLLVQAVTLKIANGCRYTPDFVSIYQPAAFRVPAFRITAYEVKGPFARDDAIVKLKVAAHAFSFISFVLVTWNKGNGVWDMENVRAMKTF